MHAGVICAVLRLRQNAMLILNFQTELARFKQDPALCRVQMRLLASAHPGIATEILASIHSKEPTMSTKGTHRDNPDLCHGQRPWAPSQGSIGAPFTKQLYCTEYEVGFSLGRSPFYIH